MSELAQAIRQIGMGAVEHSNPVKILFGTVNSVSPLSIFVDQVTTIKERELVLGRNVTDFQTEISFDNPKVKNEIQIGNRPLAPDGTIFFDPDTPAEEKKSAIFIGKFSFKEKVKHNVTVYNALKIGEKVLLLRMQGGQKFIVIDRIGVM